MAMEWVPWINDVSLVRIICVHHDQAGSTERLGHGNNRSRDDCGLRVDHQKTSFSDPGTAGQDYDTRSAFGVAVVAGDRRKRMKERSNKRIQLACWPVTPLAGRAGALAATWPAGQGRASPARS